MFSAKGNSPLKPLHLVVSNCQLCVDATLMAQLTNMGKVEMTLGYFLLFPKHEVKRQMWRLFNAVEFHGEGFYLFSVTWKSDHATHAISTGWFGEQASCQKFYKKNEIYSKCGEQYLQQQQQQQISQNATTIFPLLLLWLCKCNLCCCSFAAAASIHLTGACLPFVCKKYWNQIALLF